MAKFKVGDQVRIKRDAASISVTPDPFFVPGMRKYLGTETKVISVGQYIEVESNSWNWAEEWLEPLTKPLTEPSTKPSTKEKETMSLIDRVRELATAEPLKSFVKYGIKEQNGALTDEGMAVLLDILSDKYEADLVKVTDALAAADKAAKK